VLIQLSCPWCEAELAVDAAELDGEVRCDDCSVAFTFASVAEPDAVADAA
jgi:predicted Zn finger-like uncharacterized protein